MAVPNIFGSATSAIPLSQLDTNFATPVTIGNTAVQLGNTVTSFGNVTLTNVTVSSGNVTITGANVSGNLTFTGTGNRITGDFSNATLANRVAFQSSTTNGNTTMSFIPNGTATQTNLFLYNGSDVTTNFNLFTVRHNTSASTFASAIGGTGAYVPMTFETGGSERVRIDTSGNVGIGTTSPSSLLDLTGNDPTLQFTDSGGSPASTFSIRSADGTLKFRDVTNSSDRVTIDTSGNLLVTSVAGLGYGTGSGGTVTQATSRTTGVTLSKPTGAITMFSAAGSTTAATFTVTNTLVAATDTIILNQKSGTNLYDLLVTAVAAGSFNITFRTTGGTATDAPVINFALIKGVTA